MKALKVRIIETCLPRGILAKSENGRVFYMGKETLDQLRWRIIKELNKGCIFIFE